MAQNIYMKIKNWHLNLAPIVHIYAVKFKFIDYDKRIS